MTSINEKTTVPLWGIIAGIPALIGLIAWLTNLNALARASADSLDHVVAQQEQTEKTYQNSMESIRIELSEIKTELRLIRRR